MASHGYEWRKICRGDSIPEGAVLAGKTKSDGEVYIGRTPVGTGKLNTDNGTMYNIWVHGGKGDSEGEILVVISGKHKWVPVKSGDQLPPDALYSGRTEKDGDVYPCRDSNGEVGKLNLSTGSCRDGVVHNLWFQVYWTASKEGEILCLPQTEDTAGPAPGVGGYFTDGKYVPVAKPSPEAKPSPTPAVESSGASPSGAPAPFGIYGHRVELSNNDCTATRTESVNGGVCFSKEPLQHHPGKGYYYEVRVDAKYKSARSMAVGFAFRPAEESMRAVSTGAAGGAGQFSEDEARGKIDRCWLAGYDHGGALFISCDHEEKIPDASWRPVRTLQEGSVIGVLFSESSSPPELVVFQDGTERVRLPATGQLPTPTEELFALVDVQGNVSQATLFKAKPP